MLAQFRSKIYKSGLIGAGFAGQVVSVLGLMNSRNHARVITEFQQ
jgi:hypothetical protein